MYDLENYILSAVFLLLLCLAFYLWKTRKKNNAADTRDKFILDTLKLAQTQVETFSLKASDNDKKYSCSALLHSIDRNGLNMAVNSYIPEDWLNKEVDVYFYARRDEGPVFYVFKSVVKRVIPDYENSYLILSMPDHLQIEKKRNFMRVKPNKDDVRVIGVWTISPGAHLPRSTSNISAPVTRYKYGMKNEPVQVENISAGGMALRFTLDENGKAPMNYTKGSQFLCLVVYVLNETDEKPVVFWCTAEVMNSRVLDGDPKQLVLGLEFTNWAILEQGSSEIHWAHSSPSKGVKPISQWVKKVDKENSNKKDKTDKEN